MDLERDLAAFRTMLARLEAACRTAEDEVTRTREAGEAIGRVIVALEAGGSASEDRLRAGHGAANAAPVDEAPLGDAPQERAAPAPDRPPA